jgi:hypothetical protein
MCFYEKNFILEDFFFVNDFNDFSQVEEDLEQLDDRDIPFYNFIDLFEESDSNYTKPFVIHYFFDDNSYFLKRLNLIYENLDFFLKNYVNSKINLFIFNTVNKLELEFNDDDINFCKINSNKFYKIRNDSDLFSENIKYIKILQEKDLLILEKLFFIDFLVIIPCLNDKNIFFYKLLIGINEQNKFDINSLVKNNFNLINIKNIEMFNKENYNFENIKLFLNLNLYSDYFNKQSFKDNGDYNFNGDRKFYQFIENISYTWLCHS